LPKDVEVYFTRGDMRYAPNPPTFKVSNSAVIGNMSKRTQPRNWTADEIARLTQPPPNHSSPNIHPDVGRNTEFAGDTTGGFPNRYVEPGGLLLGIDYRTGEWDGEPCLGGVVPVFDAKQPPAPVTQRVLARDGYAVGAVRVRSKRFVNAVQLVFQKVKADGMLDPADTYESDWVGAMNVDGEPKTLAGDGTPVIGIVCQQGAIVNGLALVLK
jgi:hypothetical protein